MKIVNAIQCQKCKQIIWSTHQHDMRWCDCGTVAIDGGQAYSRILGDRENWEPHALTIKDEKLFWEGTLKEDPNKGEKIEEF